MGFERWKKLVEDTITARGQQSAQTVSKRRESGRNDGEPAKECESIEAGKGGATE